MTETKTCPVCKENTHPYNFIYNPKGDIVGCKRCSGKRPVGEVEDDKKMNEAKP